jgi:S-adenosylmethionine synthetase
MACVGRFFLRDLDGAPGDPAIIPDLIRAHFKLTPRGIIESLDLRRPIYKKTAAYGHFGRNDPDFTWEKTDKAAKLASDAGVGPAVVARK